MRRKLHIVMVIVLITVLLSGCWDRKDIESRGYVLGVAIDMYPPIPHLKEKGGPGVASPEEEEKLEQMEVHTGKPQYAMTIQLPILKKSSMASSVGGGGSGSSGGSIGSSTWEITQIGNSFISMSREMESRTDLFPYYEHLQVIVLSDKVVKEGIEEVIDFFVRFPEMRRRVRVFVSAGEAKSILDVTPKVEDFSAMYLSKIPMNAARTSRVIQKTDLGEVIQSIHAGFDFVLPRVEATEDEVKASGGAAFKNGRMVGWVSELELEAIKYIRNIYTGGVISIASPTHKGGIVAMDVTNAKTEITPIIRNDELSFDIKIKVKGDYAENVNMHTHSKLTQSFLKELETGYAKEIERICKSTITKMQEEYGADVFRFCQVVATKEPAYWEKIKDKWETIYPTVDVNINADVSIEQIGIVR